MRFRADVYKDIFHKEDVGKQQAAEIVKPDKPVEKEEKPKPRKEEPTAEDQREKESDSEDNEEPSPQGVK